MKNINQKGITIIEILVVLAIIIFFILIISFSFSKMRENQALKNGISDIVSAINKASANTMSSVNSSEYGIHFETNRIIIFKGIFFSPESSDNEIINISQPAFISNINLTGGVQEFYFNRLTNKPNKTGVITITSNSTSKIITIGATGIVSVD